MWIRVVEWNPYSDDNKHDFIDGILRPNFDTIAGVTDSVRNAESVILVQRGADRSIQLAANLFNPISNEVHTPQRLLEDYEHSEVKED